MTLHDSQAATGTRPGTLATDLLGPDGAGHPQRKLILAIMCGCLVLIVASVSSLNVAIPTIVRELDPTSAEQLWIVDSYALIFAGLLMLGGALGDRYGRKKALIIGLLIFGGASTLAAFAHDPVQLITYRGIMGIGAALIMPATLSTLTVVFAPQDRAGAIAVWAGLAGAGGVIGPVSSGLLLRTFWWGSVFFIAVPIAAAALAAIIAVVPDSADSARHRLDYTGAAISVVALVGIVFGIIEGPEIGWLDPITVGAFAVGSAASLIFVWRGRRVEHPLLDPNLFRIPRFGLGSMTITAAFLVMFGMFFLMTLYLQFVRGHSPLGSAVRLLPFSAGMILVAPRSPVLVARFGAARVVAAGFLIQSIGFATASMLDVDSGYPLVLAAIVPMATGMALLMPPTTNAIVTSLPQDKAGVASAVNDTTREVGGAVGIALLGTVSTVTYSAGMDGATDTLPEPLAELAGDSIGGAHLAASQLDPAVAADLLTVANRAFVDGTTVAFGAAAGLGLLMAGIIARFYPEGSTESERASASVMAVEVSAGASMGVPAGASIEPSVEAAALG